MAHHLVATHLAATLLVATLAEAAQPHLVLLHRVPVTVLKEQAGLNWLD